MTYKELWDKLNYEGRSYNYTNFRTDAIKVCRLEGHPMANNAFDFAWRQSHSDGHIEVLQFLRGVAEQVILKD